MACSKPMLLLLLCLLFAAMLLISSETTTTQPKHAEEEAKKKGGLDDARFPRGIFFGRGPFFRRFFRRGIFPDRGRLPGRMGRFGGNPGDRDDVGQGFLGGSPAVGGFLRGTPGGGNSTTCDRCCGRELNGYCTRCC